MCVHYRSQNRNQNPFADRFVPTRNRRFNVTPIYFSTNIEIFQMFESNLQNRILPFCVSLPQEQYYYTLF